MHSCREAMFRFEGGRLALHFAISVISWDRKMTIAVNICSVVLACQIPARLMRTGNGGHCTGRQVERLMEP